MVFAYPGLLVHVSRAVQIVDRGRYDADAENVSDTTDAYPRLVSVCRSAIINTGVVSENERFY